MPYVKKQQKSETWNKVYAFKSSFTIFIFVEIISGWLNNQCFSTQYLISKACINDVLILNHYVLHLVLKIISKSITSWKNLTLKGAQISQHGLQRMQLHSIFNGFKNGTSSEDLYFVS